MVLQFMTHGGGSPKRAAVFDFRSELRRQRRRRWRKSLNVVLFGLAGRQTGPQPAVADEAASTLAVGIRFR